MRWRRFFSALATAGFLAACDAAPSGPAVETAALDNGMQIIVIPDHRADVVTHMLWYRVGSADEPPGKSGIAHFFEHLMFRGTENIASGDFSKTVARLGGQDNAFTSYDYTAYFQRIHRDKLPVMMQMEAERMTKLIIDPDIVAVERDVILEERSLRVDSRPASLLAEQIRKRLHAGTGQAVPVIGWRDEIAALSAEDAAAFYRRYYAPDNAVLVISGAVTMAEVKPLAEQHYGPLKPSGQPRAPRRVAVDLQLADHAEIEVRADDRVRQPSWRRYYRLPKYDAADPRPFAAAHVLAGILDGGLTGRLYQSLVVDKKLAAGTAAYVDTSRLENGEFIFYAGLPPQVTGAAEIEAGFRAVADAMQAEIARIQEMPPAEDELARVKTRIAASVIYARDSQQSMAQIFGSSAMLGHSVAQVLAWPQVIEAVTAADVQQAARDWLRLEHSITGHLQGAAQ